MTVYMNVSPGRRRYRRRFRDAPRIPLCCFDTSDTRFAHGRRMEQVLTAVLKCRDGVSRVSGCGGACGSNWAHHSDGVARARVAMRGVSASAERREPELFCAPGEPSQRVGADGAPVCVRRRPAIGRRGRRTHTGARRRYSAAGAHPARTTLAGADCAAWCWALARSRLHYLNNHMLIT